MSNIYLVWLIFLCSWGCDTLCVLCGNADWQAQDGTGTQSEEICRRRQSVELSELHFCGVIYMLILQNHMTIFQNPVVSMAANLWQSVH